MTKIESVAEGLMKVSQHLDKLAKEEEKWPVDLLIEIERFSWEAYRMANALRELKEALGV